MNVLMLTQVLPYPTDSGPKIKTYNVIKYLAKNHQITLVSFTRDNQSDHVRNLEDYCHAVHTVEMKRGAIRNMCYMGLSFLTRQPFMILRDEHKVMRALIDQLIKKQTFNLVHADQLNMAQYALRVSNAYCLLDAHNALWLLYKRLSETMKPGLKKVLLGRDVRLLKRYEGRVCCEFDAVLSVTEEDKKALEEVAYQSLNIHVIPIAIDTKKELVIDRKPGPYILHIGTMYWPPNIDAVTWFINLVYPIIRQQRSDVEFDVIGTRPPPEILALKKAGLGINVTGYVEDPTFYQQRASVMVVPLLAGGGMRVKILNALAAGIPIVSTSLGCEGIDVCPGKEILIGDTPEDFAVEVLRVLNDPSLGDQLSRNGRKLVERKYDYKTVLRSLDEVYELAKSANKETQGKRSDVSG